MDLSSHHRNEIPPFFLFPLSVYCNTTQKSLPSIARSPSHIFYHRYTFILSTTFYKQPLYTSITVHYYPTPSLPAF
jgi:hypothetical protein